MLTQAFGCAGDPARSPVNPLEREPAGRRPNANVIAKPVPRSRTARRERCLADSRILDSASVSLDISQASRRALNGTHDAEISSAPANVAIHGVNDLSGSGFRGGVQQRGRLHDLPRLTVPALRYLLLNPRALNWMVSVSGQSLDGCDPPTREVLRVQLAGSRGPAVQMHCAGAALRDSAAELGAREL